MHTVRLEIVARFVDIATDALGDAREEIDALNVFPVPDGDTGTNMFLTMSSAREAMQQTLRDMGLARIAGDAHAGAPPVGEVTSEQIATALRALGRGALLGARGNSGVILAQMLGALTRILEQAPSDERASRLVAHGLRESASAAYEAVGEPVEGTILTVASEAAKAATAASEEDGARTRHVYIAAAAAARAALARTPEQLPALAQAGVVDAGGRGLTVILDAAETALTGRRPLRVPTRLGEHSIPIAAPASASPGAAESSEGPAYEVMYLLADSDADRVATLRGALAELGDSVVVIGGDDLFNVHVHTDDPGAAVEAGIGAGRPYQVRITHFATQPAGHDHGHGDQAEPCPAQEAPRRTGRAVVAVSAGPGLEQLFAEAGAVPVPGGPGERPSAGMLLEAVRGTGAAEVVLLPNDPDSVRTAEVAARTAEEDGEITVAVVPSRAQVQGLAALAVHEPGRAFSADVLEMTAAARHCRHGAVTVAVKQAFTSAGPCEAGDALGVVMGDFAVVGSDLGEVAIEVLTRLLAVGGELVTIVTGEDGDAVAATLAAWVETTQRGVDVVTYTGDQPRYPLLIAVE